jgi:hypothetical protein
MEIGTGFSYSNKHFTMHPDKIKPDTRPDDDQEQVPPPYEFSDEDTKEKIRKHLTDINDVITDNDIKNAKVPGKEKSPAKRKRIKKPGLAEGIKKPGIAEGTKTEGNPPTSWDVVN